MSRCKRTTTNSKLAKAASRACRVWEVLLVKVKCRKVIRGRLAILQKVVPNWTAVCSLIWST